MDFHETADYIKNEVQNARGQQVGRFIIEAASFEDFYGRALAHPAEALPADVWRDLLVEAMEQYRRVQTHLDAAHGKPWAEAVSDHLPA